MKKQLIMISMGLMTLTATFMSCKSDDDNNSMSNSNSELIQQATSNAMDGTWRVSSFIDSGDDETSDFNGYAFTFASNGDLSATNGTNTVNGTWSVTDSSSNSSDDDGSSSNDVDFNIFFQVSPDSNFEDLNDDWDIVSTSNTSISLIDISGGNGGTDTLVFSKI